MGQRVSQYSKGCIVLAVDNGISVWLGQKPYSKFPSVPGLASLDVYDVISTLDSSIVVLCARDSLLLYDVESNQILDQEVSVRTVRRGTFFASQSIVGVAEARQRTISCFQIRNSTLRKQAHFATGHSAEVCRVFSSDIVSSTLLLTGSKDETARIHDLSTETTIGILKGHQGGVFALSMNPERDNQVLTGGFDGTLRLWDSRNAVRQIRLVDVGDWVRSVLWTEEQPNLICCGTRGSAVKVYDVRRLKRWRQHSSEEGLEALFVLDSDGKGVWSMATIDQNRFAFSSDHSKSSFSCGVCEVWDYWTGKRLFQSRLTGSSFGMCCFPQYDDNSSHLLSLEERTKKYFIRSDLVQRGDLINRGAQGVVYQGTYQISQISSLDVAIKRFVVSRALTEEQESHGLCAAENLEHEIELMTELNHPNILKCHGCFFDEDEFDQTAPTVNVILEWCGDGDLDHWLKIHKQELTSILKLDLLLQIAKGMRHIHSQKITHSDLGLENVLVTHQTISGNVQWILKVCDFGLSNHFGSVLSGIDAGKPRYIPPNRSGSDKSKIDTYAWAIMGYEVWTGKHAYVHELRGLMSAAEQLARIRQLGLRPNLRECAGMPTSLMDLLTVGWSENSEERPTFTTIVEELEEIVEQESQLASVDVEEEPVESNELDQREEKMKGEASAILPFPVVDWSVSRVGAHFSARFGEGVGQVLISNGINGEGLMNASIRALREWGFVDVAIRKAILTEIAELEEGTESLM